MIESNIIKSFFNEELLNTVSNEKYNKIIFFNNNISIVSRNLFIASANYLNFYELYFLLDNRSRFRYNSVDFNIKHNIEDLSVLQVLSGESQLEKYKILFNSKFNISNNCISLPSPVLTTDELFHLSVLVDTRTVNLIKDVCLIKQIIEGTS